MGIAAAEVSWTKLEGNNKGIQTNFRNTSLNVSKSTKPAFKLKSTEIKFLLYSLYYAEVCNEFVELISSSLHPSNTAPFKEMLQQWQAVGKTVSTLAGLRFKPQTSCSRDECVTYWPTAWKLLSVVMCWLIGIGISNRENRCFFGIGIRGNKNVLSLRFNTAFFEALLAMNILYAN